ncbi:Uncharacterised protein g11145 [Pycnogonum litorale]
MIKERMEKENYSFTLEKLQNKYKSLVAAFKRAEDNNSKTGRSPNTCQYYEELSDLLGYKHSVHPVSLSSSNDRDTTNNDHSRDHSDIDNETEGSISEEVHRPRKRRKLSKDSMINVTCMDSLGTITTAMKESIQLRKEREEKREERERRQESREDRFMDLLEKILQPNH